MSPLAGTRAAKTPPCCADPMRQCPRNEIPKGLEAEEELPTPFPGRMRRLRRKRGRRSPAERCCLCPGPYLRPSCRARADRVGGPGARACGLFKSWGRAGPGRAGAAAGGGGGVRGARAAPAPRRAQPCAAPPAARTARHGSARRGQPSLPGTPASLRGWGHAGAPCLAAEASRELARRPAAARLRR